MKVSIYSFTLSGVDAQLVEVEVTCIPGIPSFNIVGLPDTAIKEARERVQSAIVNNGFDFPKKKIVANLAPADLKKFGSFYDLPIAIGILLASEQCNNVHNSKIAMVGELSLDGEIRPVNGILPMAIACNSKKLTNFFVPTGNYFEANQFSDIEIKPFQHLKGVLDYLSGNPLTIMVPEEEFEEQEETPLYNFDMIKGQLALKRAMVIVAAGGHNIIISGPPGCGKSLTAKSLPSILPPLSEKETLEVSRIYSIAGMLKNKKLMVTRPFRAPHHSSSEISLVGGGRVPKPGEITLAHKGVLFLDELPEFSRKALEMLRQPLEDRIITVSRVSSTVTYPADFTFVAAMNLCPCGFRGHPVPTKCSCTQGQIQKYLYKISGPIMDRIDIHLTVNQPTTREWQTANVDGKLPETLMKKLVLKAREIQERRFAGTSITSNSQMRPDMIEKYCIADGAARRMISEAYEKMDISPRVMAKCLKVARTIGDLRGHDIIQVGDISEALYLRLIDIKESSC